MKKICLLTAAAVFAASSAMPAVALTAPETAPQAQAVSAAPVSASASANGLLSGDMAFERGKTGSRGRRGHSKKGG